MTQLLPIVNAGLGYMNGLNLSNDSTTPDEIVDIASGQCRDSENKNDIVLSSAVEVDITESGAGGLDTGSVAASTFYAVHVIADSRGYESAAGLLSTSATAPTLPAGYDMFRRVGWILTDGSSDILLFQQIGSGIDRWMYYDAAISELSGGSSATFAAIDIATSVPAQATNVLCDLVYTPDGATDVAEFRQGGSSASSGLIRVGCGVAGAQRLSQMLQCDSAPSIDYKVTSGDTLSVNVCGYMDKLGL